MQLPDFVQEQYAPMGPGHRPFLGLGHPVDAQLARPLIDGVVDAADQRVRDGPFVKPHAGGVHLDKGRVGLKGRSF